MLNEIDLHASKILLVGCGGASVVNFPGWIFALKRLTTGVTVETMLTGSAKKLVTKDAMTAVSGRPYYSDGDIFSTQGEVLHRHLSEWPDIVIVAPMTLNTLAKSALFISDTLVTSVLNMTKRPVYSALSFPEHLNEFSTIEQYKNGLEDRGWTLFSQRDAFALATGKFEKFGMIDRFL